MQQPIIRKSRIEDKLAVKDAHIRSIQQICSKDYTPEQVAAWAQPPYTDDIWQKAVNEQHHQVVEIDGKIEGFCHSVVHEDGVGEILGLYFTPKAAGLGLGKKIVQQAFDYMNQFNTSKIIICSTVTVKDFYQKMGFQIVGEKSTFPIRGEEIDYFKMELTKPNKN